MDVKTLYTLVAVADHGSFNDAAKSLGISVSAISLQMRNLEDQAGRVLFDRSRRPPPLTEEGRDFVDRARDLLRDWERLSGSLKKPGDSGLLRIGAVHTVVSGLLPAALIRLRDALPALRIRLTTGLTHDLEAALTAGRIDAAIVTEPASVATGQTFTAFREDQLVVIAPVDCLKSGFRSVLQSNPYVRFNRQARVADLIESALTDRGIRVSSEMEIDTLEGVISLVGAGLGVSIVPARASVALPETVTCLDFGDPPATRKLGVLAPAKTAKKRFLDRLVEALSAAP